MKLEDVAHLVDRYALRSPASSDVIELDVAGLRIFRQPEPTTFEALVYEPVFCLIVQGQKETVIGDRTITYGAGDALIVTHDLPVTARVIDASADKPYLAVILTLDLGIVRSFYNQIEEVALPHQDAVAFGVHASDDDLIDAFGRYLRLVDEPVQAQTLGPLIAREIHFRLLMAPHGAMLRKLQARDSHASRIRHAVTQIRQGYKSALVVSELAQSAGMSVSSFHEHFRAVTETTPLQYQKHLRLMEAKRLLTEGRLSVSSIGYEVGYESVNQFSREYTRKFGGPPSRDLPRVSNTG